jgi:hypothetical protein
VIVGDAGSGDVSAAAESEAVEWRTAHGSMVDKQVLEPFGCAET